MSEKDSRGSFTDDILHAFNGTKTAQDATLSKSTSPKDLISALSSRLGKTWVIWEPETLWKEIRNTFGSLPSEIVRNKIQSAKSLLVSEAPWLDHWVFEKVIVTFNGDLPMFDRYQEPSPAMIAKGIQEMAKIRDMAFSDDVMRYIAVICREDGLIVLPDPLDVAQEHLDRLNHGAIDPELREEVRRKWKETPVNEKQHMDYTEDAVGVHLARLGSIRDYLRSA